MANKKKENDTPKVLLKDYQKICDIRKMMSEKLAERRKELEMSQEEVATLVGVQRSHISRCESGKFNYGLDMYLAIANALGVKILIPQNKLASEE